MLHTTTLAPIPKTWAVARMTEEQRQATWYGKEEQSGMQIRKARGKRDGNTEGQEGERKRREEREREERESN